MKNIGIVCEGPSDFIMLRALTDLILKDDNYYVKLQPEDNLAGSYGNGWKGVWKWCKDNAPLKEQIMDQVSPQLDMLIIQVDGDVSRKEKISHCWCDANTCKLKGKEDPLTCDSVEQLRRQCPLTLPCSSHDQTPRGYQMHLEELVEKLLLHNTERTCIVIPCDSTDAWILAAFDEREDAEFIRDPWRSVISNNKYYHDIRIKGHNKDRNTYRQLTDCVCDKWDVVKNICISAEKFERDIREIE